MKKNRKITKGEINEIVFYLIRNGISYTISEDVKTKEVKIIFDDVK